MNAPAAASAILVRRLGRRAYEATYAAMREFTATRNPDTPDELWLLEHPPVFTLGQASRAEHLLAPGDIPVVQSNRGGQVTYHGPGQIVAYLLLDLRRRGYGPRDLVRRLERAMIATLADYGIAARARADAPGVYVERVDWPDGGGRIEQRKIGSLGLRVSRGCSYHGLALNVNMDLEPFSRIEPCGLRGMRVTQVADLGGPRQLEPVARRLEAHLLRWCAMAE
ncbi:MAG: lipoyl(octanoyl) transferase LipB [Sinobacteraceae bacterium]|nr:lipoyl(octanoyl) transferase LipB [Nevskiaceae bacterium]